MSLADRLAEYVRACFAGLWIRSYEQDDALQEIGRLCHRQSWRLASWDIDQGLRFHGTAEAPAVTAIDPLSILRALPTLATPDGTVLLVLHNFHRFLSSPEVIQTLMRQVQQGKLHRTFVVILAPVVSLPPELEKLFITLEHELPSRDQLLGIARGVATEEGELPEGPELQRVLDAAAGLTRYEAEGAFSLAVVRQGRIEPEPIWQLKSQTLLKGGLLSLHRGGETFEQLGGLDSLKAFCLRALRSGRTADSCRPRGILLLGIPGTGKSAFAKSLGRETGRPTLILDIGALMGSLVGQTEERTRQALAIVDAMQPAILFVDEIEKGLSGASGGSQTDSGVSARMFGTLLTWLNDHTSDVFVVCTANDVSKLPPEFSRAERFDGIFFLDLPGEAQKEAIWKQYLREFNLDPQQKWPSDANWTGAEVKSACRLAALLDMPLIEAAQNVVPVAVTAAESVERLRTWASGRCLSADQAGIYVRPQVGPSARRRVSRDPSNN
jgi:hypothetical protein